MSEVVTNSNFIKDIIESDISTGKHNKIITRFPPEPNGYLHIGHAKAFCLSFGIAEQYNGQCNLRFDDTNPEKESVEYIEAIKKDVEWLGFNWGENLHFASGYFGFIYNAAVELIKDGKAFVCDLTTEEMREHRGNLVEAGKNSPYRDRTVEENLELFEKMKNGEFDDGAKVLRAKIDMSSPNLNLRDPIIYRIMKVHHHKVGDEWSIYPMYDFTHPISDALEHITHSLCTLEFEDHRPLYNWVIENVTLPAVPRQIEFARLNLTHTVMSKRKLLRLVEEGFVSGWDDPRMPTISGMRRRGYPAESIRDFIDRIGVAKRESTVDFALLEHCVRENLNKSALRFLGVLNPLKVVIENYPDDLVEELEGVNNPENEADGTRKIPFSKVIYVEKEDFMEDAPKKFFRLSVGREVRLRYAYYITCTEVIKDANGEVIELRATYDPDSKGGTADGRKVKGTIHWVSAEKSIPAEIRLYNQLFTEENPDRNDEGKEFVDYINSDSFEVLEAMVEPAVKNLASNNPFQFERKGYFIKDEDSTDSKLVFNRTANLRDSWGKKQKKK